MRNGKMGEQFKTNNSLFLPIVGLAGWVVPGAGYLFLNDRKRAAIIFVTIVALFCIGLHAGSIGVVDFVGEAPFYVKIAQYFNPPVVFIIAHTTAGGQYPVAGWPNDIGQIYTMLSGLLNFLCITNALYLAYLRQYGNDGE